MIMPQGEDNGFGKTFGPRQKPRSARLYPVRRSDLTNAYWKSLGMDYITNQVTGEVRNPKVTPIGNRPYSPQGRGRSISSTKVAGNVRGQQADNRLAEMEIAPKRVSPSKPTEYPQTYEGMYPRKYAIKRYTPFDAARFARDYRPSAGRARPRMGAGAKAGMTIAAGAAAGGLGSILRELMGRNKR